MANTFKFGNGEWAVGKETALAYNDENSNFKPLPFTFDRASTATVVNKDGLIETVGVDEPRIDFLNNTKGHLLLEPQRQNTLPYSQDFSQWSATSGGSVVSDQEGIGGSNDAFEFVSDGSANSRIFYTISATGAHSFSVFAKKNTLDYIALYANDDNNGRVWYNLADGTLGNEEGNATGAIEDYGNGWYRCTLKWTSSNLVNFRIYNSNANDVFGGTAGSVFIQYAQLEQGSYATSYIPTSGQSGGVTRSAETCSQTVPDGITQESEMTLYAEFEYLGGEDTTIISAHNNSNSVVWILVNSTNQLSGTNFYNSFNGTVTMPSTITPNTRYKVAYRTKSGDSALYVNGISQGISTGTISNPNTLSRIELGSFWSGVNVNTNSKIIEAKCYNSALSNTELAALTT